MVYVGTSHVAQLVRQALAEDPRTRDLVIEVSYNRGTLTLIGSVPTWQQREAVEEVALAQPGIDSLVLDVGVEERVDDDRMIVAGNVSADEV